MHLCRPGQQHRLGPAIVGLLQGDLRRRVRENIHFHRRRARFLARIIPIRAIVTYVADAVAVAVFLQRIELVRAIVRVVRDAVAVPIRRRRLGGQDAVLGQQGVLLCQPFHDHAGSAARLTPLDAHPREEIGGRGRQRDHRRGGIAVVVHLQSSLGMDELELRGVVAQPPAILGVELKGRHPLVGRFNFPITHPRENEAGLHRQHGGERAAIAAGTAGDAHEPGRLRLAARQINLHVPQFSIAAAVVSHRNRGHAHQR